MYVGVLRCRTLLARLTNPHVPEQSQVSNQRPSAYHCYSVGHVHLAGCGTPQLRVAAGLLGLQRLRVAAGKRCGSRIHHQQSRACNLLGCACASWRVDSPWLRLLHVVAP